MALTKAQMNDAVQLAQLIDQTKKAKSDSLRQIDVGTRQALRRVRQNNALNGINGGWEESTYLRAQSGANANRAAVLAQYDPLLTEYQGYLDRLNARRAASSSAVSARKQESGDSGVGSGKYASIPSDIYYQMFQSNNPLLNGAYSRGYTASVKNGKTTYTPHLV